VLLTRFQALYEVSPPYASAYLDTSRNAENAEKEIELRWDGLRRGLADEGASESLLDQLGEAALTPTGHPGPHGLGLIGAGDRVLQQHFLPRPPPRNTASWEPLPDLMPLIRQFAWAVPYLLVLVDRVGADLRLVGAGGSELEEQQVEGTAYEIRKPRELGWSEYRVQHTAENRIRENAELVARAVDRIVASSRVSLVAIGGEPRALGALREVLTERVRPLVVELEHGSRAAGASEDALQDELDKQVATRAVEQSVEVFQRFETGRGARDDAVEGLDGVVEALRKAQVDTLLLHDDPQATTKLWIGPDPLLLALNRDDVVGLGVEKPVQARGDAALLRALVGSDAGIVLVAQGGPKLEDGIGAVLRYA
jgi:hypothetical protein